MSGQADEQQRRYRYHLALPDFGSDGQRRLHEGSVLIIGVGGLGSPVALYLAAAGVGHIGLVDDDLVEESNLQRQIAHTTDAIGTPKIESARQRMLDINPSIEITTYPTRFIQENAHFLLPSYDVVVDASDNIETRYLSSDICARFGKPNVYGSVQAYEGQASVFDVQRGGPCYRCLYPTPPPPGTIPSTRETGVLSTLPGVIGTIQATETIKLLTGIGTPLIGQLFLYNAREITFTLVALPRNPTCPVCQQNHTHPDLI